MVQNDRAEHLKMVQNTLNTTLIGWDLTVLCLRIGQKVFVRWF